MRNTLLDETSKIEQLPQSHINSSLKKQLSEGNACYVLITCSNPSADGKMSVEMSYEGDADLAAMLIEKAQGYIEEDAL